MERLFQWLEQDEALKEASSSYENGKIYGVYGLGGSAKSAYDGPGKWLDDRPSVFFSSSSGLHISFSSTHGFYHDD